MIAAALAVGPALLRQALLLSRMKLHLSRMIDFFTEPGLQLAQMMGHRVMERLHLWQTIDFFAVPGLHLSRMIDFLAVPGLHLSQMKLPLAEMRLLLSQMKLHPG